MTIEKIKVQHPTSYNMALIEEKLNTIIDWINEHDNSGRHIVPSNSLTGGERTTEQKIVDHILYEKRLKSTSGEKCEHGGECYSDNGYSKTIPFGYCAKFPKPEPKSNTLREEAGEEIREQMHKILHRIYADTYNQHKDIETLLSLVKEHLEKEINQSLKETKYDDNDREWAAKLQYNKAIYDIKQIIKNL